jgi:endonuclease/exonuclease/phosphatase family metal-dependent hydrolase
MRYRFCSVALILAAWLGTGARAAETTFTVATYNLENYLLEPVGTREAKAPAARAKNREFIRALNADVLAVQEIGLARAFDELRASLKAEGLDYPHSEHVGGWNTNISVGVLSRFPIVARRSHTNLSYLLQGRRFSVSRGFAEVDIRVTPQYTFTLMTAHLKSRRQVASANEADLREQEARLLREQIEAVLRRNPNANLVVCGDLNDTKDSVPIRTILGQGRTALVDTRPAERNGDNTPSANPRWEPRTITWTHYYGREDTYQRIDYLLVSAGMAREWQPAGTYVFAAPNWGAASDHRPIVATFVARDR